MEPIGAPPKPVFFGMHGPFSATLLRALLATDLAPSLVVVGVEKPKGRPGPVVNIIPAKPNFWQKLLGATDAGVPAGPGVVDLTEVARGAGLDVIVTSDPDLIGVRAAIHGAAPSALVIAGFPKLLSPRVLALAPRGGLNVHPGALPAERGPAPLFWALKSGKTRLTVTVHVVDESEDTGDVVSSTIYEVEPGTDGQEILRRAAMIASPHLIRALRGMLAGDLVRTVQSKSGASRRPRPVFRDGLIDPTQRAVDVHTFVGGCAKHYSLFVEVAGDRFFVRSSRGYQEGGRLPSEYLVSGDLLLLQCRDGVAELDLKPQGAVFSSTYREE